MDSKFMTPEMVDQLIALSNSSEQERILEEQIAQAHALRNKQGPQYTMPLAAAIGGIGNIFNGVTGAVEESQLRNKQQDMLAKDLELRKLYGKGLFGDVGKGPGKTMDVSPNIKPVPQTGQDTGGGEPGEAAQAAEASTGLPQSRRDLIAALYGDGSKPPVGQRLPEDYY